MHTEVSERTRPPLSMYKTGRTEGRTDGLTGGQFNFNMPPFGGIKINK
jgi:hypothetical protein